MNDMIRRNIFSLLIVGFVLFSLVPTFYELSRAGDIQPNRHFELVHNFYTDYNFYLSRIREGLSGRWTVVEKYTSEPHSGSLIHEMYLLMGRVGRMVRVPWGRAGDVYHVARVVLAVVLLAMIAEFSRGAWGNKGNWGLMGFLLAVTASSWPKLVAVVHNGVVPATVANMGYWRFGGYMPWWSVMDSLQRITFIPHILAGQALMIFLVLSLTSSAVLARQGNVVFLGILAFVLGMIFPPGLLFVVGVIGVFGMIRALWEKNIRWSQWLFWCGVFAISASSLVYLALVTGFYPWHRLTELDILHPLPFDYLEYFKAVGPIGVLGVIGGIWAVMKKEKAMLPAVSWILAWLGFLGIFHFVPQQSPLRFSEMIPQVALGILTAYTFFRLGHLRNLGNLSRIAAILLITLGLLQMYSSVLWQKDFIDQKIRATVPLVPTGSYVMYPLKDFYTAILYLEDHTKQSDVILSETTAGNYIPVYSGNTVFVGHDNTVNAERKKEDVRMFFSGRMSADTARQFLTAIGVHTIFFGPQEQDDSNGVPLTQYYPFLILTYTNPSVTIYTAP